MGARIAIGVVVVLLIAIAAVFSRSASSGTTPEEPAADSTAVAAADTATFALRGGIDSFVVFPPDAVDSIDPASLDFGEGDGAMTANAIDARLATLLAEAQTGQAERVLRELPPLLGQLSGNQLGEAYYVQMIAASFVQDESGVCRAAAGVIGLHTVPSRIALARRASQLMSCEAQGS